MPEIFADLPNGHPGCLIASICYHEQLFDRDVCEVNAAAVLGWRERFLERLVRIETRYAPRIDIRLEDLADMLSAVANGGIILSKVTRDARALPRQLLLCRDFVKLVFNPPAQ